MLIYILASTVAALIQVGTIYLLRENILKSLFYAIPFILIHQLLFNWSYSNAPKFLIIWFITVALTSSAAFLAGYFIWEEQVSAYNVAGIVFILAGVVLLRLG